MNNNTIYNGIEDIRTVTMNADEKKRIHDAVLGSPVLSPRPVRSLWVAPLFFVNQFKRFYKKATVFYKKRV